MADTSSSPPPPPTERSSPNLYVSLTHAPLSPTAILDRVRSPSAGALVLFAGTTRDTFDARPVRDLTYQAYAPLALGTMHDIAAGVRDKHGLRAVAIVHRLGAVPIGEESILIAVSSAHRAEAWRAGEECLEEVKRRVEVWKLERFEDDGEGVWRANRDGALGVRETVGDGGGDGGGEEKNEGGGAKSNGGAGEENEVPETMGPVIRPRRPGEKGHGAVVNPKRAPPG